MTRGCKRPSSQTSASRSPTTRSRISALSLVPKRCSSADFTSGSSYSSWTTSSLEIVAAPWRAKAASASLFPAPMPPVIATASGLCGLVSLVRRGRGLTLGVAGALLFGGARIGFDARIRLFGLDLGPSGRNVGRGFGDRGLGLCVGALGFRVRGLGLCVRALGFRARGLGLCVRALGFRVRGLGLCVRALGF